MDTRRLFLFGVLGGALMTVTLTFARAFGLATNLELLLGTWVGIPPGLMAWLVGLGLHLAFAGLLGIVYGVAMERLPPHHGGWDVGMLYAILHVFIAGSILSALPEIHPYIPARLDEPGPFFASFGLMAVFLFIVSHLVYGAVVGEGVASTVRRAQRRATTTRHRGHGASSRNSSV